jgi:hypothetical protein
VSTIKATVRGGQLELERPIELPDGTELLIPVPDAPDDDAPLSKDEIDRVLASVDRMIPFELTPEDEARLEADRRSRKAWELGHAEPRAETLKGLWP